MASTTRGRPAKRANGRVKKQELTDFERAVLKAVATGYPGAVHVQYIKDLLKQDSRWSYDDLAGSNIFATLDALRGKKLITRRRVNLTLYYKSNKGK